MDREAALCGEHIWRSTVCGGKLKDSRNFLNVLSMITMLKETIAPYQKWGQKRRASAFERKFQMKKLKLKVDALKKAKKVGEGIAKHLEKINFGENEFKKIEGKNKILPGNERKCRESNFEKSDTNGRARLHKES